MKIDVKFTESTSEFPVSFGEVTEIKNGFTQDEVDKIAAEKADEAFEAGKKAEYDAFWDNFQDSGNRRDYYGAFRGSYWNDENGNIKYPIIIDNSSSLTSYNTFYKVHITTINVPIIIQSNLMRETFYHNAYLKTIKLLEVTEETEFQNAFNGCTALENIEIKGSIGKSIKLQWPTNLSKHSIINIINVLNNKAENKNITLSKTAVNKAFETSPGAADGSTSDEWTALIATKPNWTISLV